MFSLMDEVVEDVRRFNKEVIKSVIPPDPFRLPANGKSWLADALHEEADELREAESLVDAVDACGDSIIFALGGLMKMGLSNLQISQVLDIIMAANFTKKSGVKPGRAGAPDVVKPKGFQDPKVKIAELLGEVL